MATTITANGINFPDGSAGSPSIGGSDTNTGLFTGSDIIGFSTGGNERLRVDASGNVGIGTASPDQPLHIKSNTPYIKFEDDNDNQDWQIEARSFFSIYDVTDSAHRLAIDSAGKIGIGTTSPEVMLDIRANDPGIQLVDTGGTSTYGNIDFIGDTLILTSRGGSSSDGIIDFRRYDGTTIDTSMRINSSGEVYIGTIENGSSDRGKIAIKAVNDQAGSPINVYLQEASGGEGYGIGIDSDGDLNFHNSGSTTPSLEVRDDNNVAVTDGNLILASGHGIDFSDTSDATGGTSELLDDYEEGTWTPVPENLTNNPTFYNQQGKYVKIGSFVTIWGFIQLGSAATFTNDTQHLHIAGLPFAANDTTGYVAGVGPTTHQNFYWRGSTYNDYGANGPCFCGVANSTRTMFQVLGDVNNAVRGTLRRKALSASNPILTWTISYRTTA